MVAKIVYFTFILIVSTLFCVNSSPSTPNETEKLIELTERLDKLQNKVETLESENETLFTRFDGLKVENTELRSEVKELKVKVVKQDEEILLLKSHVSNLESLLPTSKLASIDAANVSYNTNFGTALAELGGPPSSCQKLRDGNSLIPMDGIHLLKTNNKIQAAFCKFPRDGSPVVQKLIGTVDVKTKTVHFFVQRNSIFSICNAVIPFELARMNEGGAFNLTSGIFTIPEAGIYHFDFSAVKYITTNHLDIFLQVTGANLVVAWTSQTSNGSYDSEYMSASLRLAVGDTVKLYNSGGGVLFDNSNHHTHFTGWLVEEDLLM